MDTVKPKTTVQQRILATCPTHSRTDLQVRDLESVIDEPEERDGTNLGFTPTETLIATQAMTVAGNPGWVNPASTAASRCPPAPFPCPRVPVRARR